jgi:hypothetical protein
MYGTAAEESDYSSVRGPGRGLSRRQLIGSGVAATVLATVGGTAVASPGRAALDRGGQSPSPARRGYAFLDAAMDGYPSFGPIRLAQSYTDQAGLFSAAFTYDNGIAILAYLADCTQASLARATALGDALLFAQNNDPVHTDGRLRQGYNVGPYTFYDGSPQPDGFVRADGKANICSQFGFVGTAVGDMAWAGIALTALARRTRARRFRDAAVRIGEWIHSNGRTDEPLGGYKFGVDGNNAELPFTSCEHNIDLIGLFGQLAQLTGSRIWLRRRETALAFVKKMWEPDGQFFYTGTNDGVLVNKAPIPEDTQTWSYLALEARRYERSLDWELRNLAVLDTPERKNSTLTAGQSFDGVTFSSASLTANEDAPIAEFQPKPNRNGVWFEGTAHLALALRERGDRGDETIARRLLASTEKAQDQLGTGQTIGGRALPERAGVVSASSPLDTGFGFGYYPYRHTGATGWYLLAVNRSNPLDRP